MEERAKRIGHNEAVFRDVNERIEELAESLRLDETRLELVCECGDATCMAPISMSKAEYEELRADPPLFAVVPGHEASDVERIVDKRPAYDLVRKREGLPTAIAESTDPRSP